MIRCAWALAFAAQAALGATPVITELQPRGAEIGRPFTLTAIGRNLGEGARLISTLPATFTLVLRPQTPGTVAVPGRSAAFWLSRGLMRRPESIQSELNRRPASPTSCSLRWGHFPK